MIDGVGRDQVPVYRVAERLVKADAAHIDGNTLRGALQWRCEEAPIAESLRGAVAVRIGQGDTRNPLKERVGNERRLSAGEVGGGQGLHRARHLVAIDVPA